MTFAQYVGGDWRRHLQSLRPSTQTRTRWLLDHALLPAFGDADVSRIVGPDVIEWYDALAATAPGNANRALDVLHQIIVHATRRGHGPPVDPCRGVRRVKQHMRLRYLTAEELRIVQRELRRIEPRGRSGRDQVVLIRLLLLTGMRYGEACSLRWADIHAGAVRVRNGKTGPRTVALSQAALDLLAEHRQREGTTCPWVFPDQDGTGPRRSCLATWRVVRIRAGVPDVRVHDLRHTFASHAVMRGVPLPIVSRLLGHASLQMTMRYAHVGDQETAAAAALVSNRIDGWMDGAVRSDTLTRP